jgi:hypothetical protein
MNKTIRPAYDFSRLVDHDFVKPAPRKNRIASVRTFLTARDYANVPYVLPSDDKTEAKHDTLFRCGC